eukprot:gene3203-3246_t
MNSSINLNFKAVLAQTCLTSTTAITTVATTTTYGGTASSNPGSNNCYLWTGGNLTFGSYTNFSSTVANGGNLINFGSNNVPYAFTNYGTITFNYSGGDAFSVFGGTGTVASATNYGTINSISSKFVAGMGSYGGYIGTVNNSGTISTTGSSIKFVSDGYFGTVSNSGTLTSSLNTADGINAHTASKSLTYGSVTNTGLIKASGDGIALYSASATKLGTISSVTNSGSILSIATAGGHDNALNSGADNGSGIYTGFAATTVSNSGTISTAVGYGIYNDTPGNITTLTNTGSIAATGSSRYGIYNLGTIGTLNNSQGAGNANGALTYSGKLPTNYNIIINSATNFGRLAVTAVTGSTLFGISSLSTPGAILNTPLTSVLSGITPTQLGLSGTATSTSAISNGYTYTLSETGSSVLALDAEDRATQSIVLANVGGTIAAPTSGKATLSGPLTGVGPLTVTGSGTLSLTAVNTYTGGTTVSSGTLSVAGSSPTGTGDVVVASAAGLMGTGTIPGNVLVYGLLKPGNSPGYLAATNNLTLNSGSVYQQDIAGTTQASSTSPVGATGYYSFMNVGGQLTINSGATLTPTLQSLFQTTESGYGSASYVPNLGDTFRIVTALGGISGAFTSVSQPAGLASGTQFIPFYNYAGSNSIDLAVIPTSYSSTLANSSRNSLSVASALDRLSAAQFAGTATTTQSNLMYATATQTLSSLPSFSQALAGEVYGAALVTVPQATLRAQSAVMARLGDKSLGAAPGMNSPIINPTGVTAQNPMGEPNASVSTNPTVNPTEDLAIPYRPNVWGEIAYQYGSRSSDSNASGYNSSLYQAVFGTDLYQENGIKAGVGFTLSTTGLTNNNGSGTVGQESIFVYGKLPVFENYVLDGMASFGMSNTSVTRNDPTSSASLKGKNILGNDTLLSLGISRPVEVSDYNLIFTPYARVTWQMVNQSPFDEGTASVAALSVNGYSGNGVRGVIGLSAGSLNKDPMVDDYTYSVNLAVGADTNTLINPTLTANLAGFGTNIYTANVGSVFVQAGLRGTAKVANSAYAYAGITGETRTGQSLGVVNLSVTLLSARYCSLLQASDVLLLASVEQRRFCLPMGRQINDGAYSDLGKALLVSNSLTQNLEMPYSLIFDTKISECGTQVTKLALVGKTERHNPQGLEDCVLDHEIPHVWVLKNALSDRKTKSSIRCVPLVGVSPQAAKKTNDFLSLAGLSSLARPALFVTYPRYQTIG